MRSLFRASAVVVLVSKAEQVLGFDDDHWFCEKISNEIVLEKCLAHSR